MAKKPVEKLRADGNWTEVQYATFIRNQLRRGWSKWPPKALIEREARVERGVYLCAGCKENVPTTFKNEEGKRKKNVNVDHIVPATPLHGEWDWTLLINRMYCERDNLQLLCYKCHHFKTHYVERRLAKVISGSPVEVGEMGELELEGEAKGEDRDIVLKDKEGNLYKVLDILRSNGGQWHPTPKQE